MARKLRGLLLLVMLASAACGSPTISDTGYEGTWKRGNDLIQSTIAIVKRGEGYLFRWGMESRDGRIKVRCDWEGACQEFSDGLQVAEYQFRTWVDDDSGRLRIECRGRYFESDGREFQYVDELRLHDEGTRLVSRTIEQSGQQLKRRQQPKRSFDKISDRVVDPPAAHAG